MATEAEIVVTWGRRREEILDRLLDDKTTYRCAVRRKGKFSAPSEPTNPAFDVLVFRLEEVGRYADERGDRYRLLRVVCDRHDGNPPLTVWMDVRRL